MPQIQLYPQDDGGPTLATASGTGIYLPLYRLRVWARLGGEFAQRQAILDTGAPLCILSKQVWAPLHDRGSIEWLCHPPGPDAGESLPRIAVLHGIYPFRLGRLPVQLVDLGTGLLPPTTAMVQCTEDERPDAPGARPLPHLLILGMAGLLNGRKLTLTASRDGPVWSGTLSE